MGENADDDHFKNYENDAEDDAEGDAEDDAKDDYEDDAEDDAEYDSEDDVEDNAEDNADDAMDGPHLESLWNLASSGWASAWPRVSTYSLARSTPEATSWGEEEN